MKQKCLIVLASILAVAFTASIPQRSQRSAAIPVQVVYDRPDAAVPNVRNLEETPQVVAAAEDAQKTRPPIAALKNLEAKPQVSRDHNKQQNARNEETNKLKVATLDQAAPTSIDVDVYQKIQEIIDNGAKKIHNDFEKIPDGPQKQEILQKVDTTLEEFLDSTKKLIALRGVNTLKQDATTTEAPLFNPFGVIPQILGLFQTFSNNFVQGFSGSNQPASTLGDATTAAPGGFPNPVTVVLSAFSQLQDNISQLFNIRPPQNDESPAGSAAPGSNNPFQFIQQTVSSFLNRPNQASATQNDQQPAPVNPVIGFVQNAISAFQPTTGAPVAQDEVPQASPTTVASVQGVLNGTVTFLQTAQQNAANAWQSIPGVTQVLESGSPTNPVQNGQNAINQITGQIPTNPIQEQTQQAVQQAAGQVSHVGDQLNQQGVPTGQVNPAISQAQSIAQQVPTSPPNIPKPPAVPSIPNTRSEPEVPAVPEPNVAVADDVTVQKEELKGNTRKENLEPSQVPVNEEISNEVNETQKGQNAEDEVEKEATKVVA